MFGDYRKAVDEMEADVDIALLRDKIGALQEQLLMAELPYRTRMAKAEEEIKAAVLKQGESVTLFNIRATYTKGRKSTSWMKVAKELEPPAELVAKHTKHGDPSVNIEVLQEQADAE